MIRPIEIEDKKGWEKLYRSYADFYKVEMNDEILTTVWKWLFDQKHEVSGLVYEENSKIVALAHYRKMPSPLRGKYIGFLDDLFVVPENRSGGAAAALIKAVQAAAKAEGWGVVRWITRENNYRARGLYDKLAEKTDWALYEMAAK